MEFNGFVECFSKRKREPSNLNIFKNQSDVIYVNFHTYLPFIYFPAHCTNESLYERNAGSVRSVCSLECSNAGVEIVFVTPLNYGRSF